MENKTKNILVLTLGVGFAVDTEAVTDDNKNKKVELKGSESEVKRIISGQYKYRLAKYSMEYNGDKTLESCFVAEPIIENAGIEFDKIVVIGTSASMWTAFFWKMLGKKQEEVDDEIIKDMSTILQVESETIDLNESSKIVNDKQKKIQSIFDKYKLDRYKVVLLRYGLDDSQLNDNYKIIKQIEDVMDKDIENKVSIDITHSFRSMSFYNLVAINYIKSLGEYDIKIKNVYYGNIEIKNDNNNIAPIVNLRVLTDAIELSNGIVEFQNTGNAITILKKLEENKANKEFVRILKEFDMATQFNDFTMFDKSLQELKQYECKEDNFLIFDAEMTIKSILNLFFPVGKEFFQELKLNEKKYDSKWDRAIKQYYLSSWYLKQNRYGMAIATALECARSFAAISYKEVKNDERNAENEDLRKNAEQELMERIATVTNKQEYSESFYKKCKDIRNKFAHNLKREVVFQSDEMISLEEEKYIEKYINEFMIVAIKHIVDEPKGLFGKTSNTKKTKLNSFVLFYDDERDYVGKYPELLRCSKSKKYEFVRFANEEKIRAMQNDKKISYMLENIESNMVSDTKFEMIITNMSIADACNIAFVFREKGFDANVYLVKRTRYIRNLTRLNYEEYAINLNKFFRTKLVETKYVGSDSKKFECDEEFRIV